jgi:hypothetical protein
MIGGNDIFSVVVYLVFAILIGALFFFSFILIPGFLLVCLAFLIGFALGRANKRGVRTAVEAPNYPSSS